MVVEFGGGLASCHMTIHSVCSPIYIDIYIYMCIYACKESHTLHSSSSSSSSSSNSVAGIKYFAGRICEMLHWPQNFNY
jgi:hypothetical protein